MVSIFLSMEHMLLQQKDALLEMCRDKIGFAVLIALFQ
jgi:hypothetical protein